jgi:hypothetical protein
MMQRWVARRIETEWVEFLRILFSLPG